MVGILLGRSLEGQEIHVTSSPRSLHSIFWHNQAHQSPKSFRLNFAFISLHPKTTAVEVSATGTSHRVLVGNGSLGTQSCGGPLGQLQLLGVHENNAHSIPLKTLYHSLPPHCLALTIFPRHRLQYSEPQTEGNG